jgi:tetratricopeptide (TPR) repeat protein
VLSPFYKTIYTLIVVGAEKIQKDQYLKSEDAEILAILSRFTDYGISAEIIYSDFKVITQNQLIDKNDTLMYINSYKTIIQAISDTNLNADISHFFHKSLAIHYSKISNFEKSLNEIEKAFFIKPYNVETLLILSEIFNANFSKNIDYRDNYDEMYSRIEKYYLFNQEIKDAKNLGLFRLYYWIYKANIQLNKGNVAEADNYLNTFEKLLPSVQTNFLIFDIQNLYIKLSMYYYKKYNNKKAKEYIVRGLKVLPDNYELRRHLKAF